jgi:hypothetical protein
MRPEPRKARLAGLLFGLGLIGGIAAGGPSQAADDPKGDNTVSEVVVIAHRPPTVEELTVVARAECLRAKSEHRSDRPKIVSTYPRQGEVVRPGLLIMRVTFDMPMTCSGFFAVSPGRKNPCAASEQHFLMTFDHKTVRVACVVEPDTHYVLQLNGWVGMPDGVSATPQFVSLGGQPLDVSHMRFSVSGAAPIDTIRDALLADPETVLPDIYRPAQKTAASAPQP